MDVRQYRLANGITVKQIVTALRKEYPKYSKATQSMVEHPARYGVRLVPEAEGIITGAFGSDAARTADRHRNKHRLSCRVTDSRYSAVKQAIEADGRFSSVQELLFWLVYGWLKGQKKTAARGSNTGSGEVGKADIN